MPDYYLLFGGLRLHQTTYMHDYRCAFLHKKNGDFGELKCNTRYFELAKKNYKSAPEALRIAQTRSRA
jgi:hypothetical protein